MNSILVHLDEKLQLLIIHMPCQYISNYIQTYIYIKNLHGTLPHYIQNQQSIDGLHQMIVFACVNLIHFSQLNYFVKIYSHQHFFSGTLHLNFSDCCFYINFKVSKKVKVFSSSNFLIYLLHQLFSILNCFLSILSLHYYFCYLAVFINYIYYSYFWVFFEGLYCCCWLLRDSKRQQVVKCKFYRNLYLIPLCYFPYYFWQWMLLVVMTVEVVVLLAELRIILGNSAISHLHVVGLPYFARNIYFIQI